MIALRRAAFAAYLAIFFAVMDSAARAADTAPAPVRIATGQRAFVIPFELEPPREPSLAAVEVRLLLSRDGGASWQVADRAAPKAMRFDFRAPDDGEYWFALQTVDRDGRSFPSGDPRAGLIVVVDTSKSAAAPARAPATPPANETRAQPWPADSNTDVPVERAMDSAAAPKTAPVHARVASRAADDYRQAGLAELPAGERPRFVATRSFKLAYDVEDALATDLIRVEMWQTTDAGVTWRRSATAERDDIPASRPFQVAVERDGLYGFRLAAATRRGADERPPQSGDSPQVWVFVDTAPPDVRITDVKITAAPLRKPQGADADLVIQWQAADAALTHRPITLSYSATPGGPWTTLAGGLENNSSYAWPLDGRLPSRLYLRIEAIDGSGNVGRHERIEPVVMPPASGS